MHLRRTVTAVAALIGMLFLQAAIAFSPCNLPGRAAATAMAAAMASMPGCQSGEQATLGLAHCTSEQAVMPSVRAEPPHPALPSAVSVFPGLSKSVPSVAWRATPPPAVGPPPRIVFHSFLL